MIIHKLEACFGRLQNETLSLFPGLNVIETPNEGGKSTWAAFIRAMLYGVDSAARERRGYLPDKRRYAPWSGQPMQGTLHCTAAGRGLTIERTTAKATAPMGRCTVRDTATGEPANELTGETVGHALTGVEEEVFIRSAFIRQTGLAVDQSAALERRIASLFSTGEEDVSYSEAQRRLRDWQNLRRVNRTVGAIPRIEAELREIDARRETLRAANAQAAAARAEKESLFSLRQTLEAEISAHTRRALLRRRARRREAEAELAEALRLREKLLEGGAPPSPEVLREAEDALSRLRALGGPFPPAEEDGLDDGPFAGLSPDEAWQKAEEDRARAEEAEARLREKPVLPIVLAALALLAYAGTGLAYALKLPVPVLPMAGLSLCLTILPPTLLLIWNRRRVADIETSEEVLRRYGVRTPGAVLQRAADYRAACDARTAESARRAAYEEALSSLRARTRTFAPEEDIAAALSRAWERRRRLDEAEIRLEGLRRRCAEFYAESGPEDPDAPDEEDAPEPSPPAMEEGAARAALLACNERIAAATAAESRAEGELAALGDPAALEALRARLEQRREILEEEYAALAHAQTALEAAHLELQARFSPLLNARAGEIMKRLTRGRYHAVTLDRTLSAAVRAEGESVSRDAAFLSRGALDQLYLAVRLAVCDAALPGDRAVPLILDDAFANFDEFRLKAALDYLTEWSAGRQILLFTCHGREGAYLAGRDGVHILRAGPEEPAPLAPPSLDMERKNA